MPITRSGSYIANTPALGGDVLGDLDTIISFVNGLETTKLDVTGGTLANLTVTGTLTVPAASTFNGVTIFNEDVTIQDNTKNLTVKGKILVDTIDEFTGAGGITFLNEIKVNEIKPRTGTNIDITGADLSIAAGKKLKTDDLNSKSGSGIAVNDDLLVDAGKKIDVDTLETDTLGSNAAFITVEKNLVGAAAVAADFDSGLFDAATIATLGFAGNVISKVDNKIDFGDGLGLLEIRHGNTDGVRIRDAAGTQGTLHVNELRDIGLTDLYLEYAAGLVKINQVGNITRVLGTFELTGIPAADPGGSGLVWDNSGVLNIT